jgi:ADP-heptose:LPS heptosyltransferase
MSPVTSERGGVRRALIVHTGGGLGDLITTSPLADALKEQFPGVHVTVWTLPRHARILDRHPGVDRVWVEAATAPLGALFRDLRASRYDAVIFTWARDRQVWLAWLAGIPIRVGPARRLAYGFLFTHRVRVRSEFGDQRSHWVDVQLDYAVGVQKDGTLRSQNPSPPKSSLAWARVEHVLAAE